MPLGREAKSEATLYFQVAIFIWVVRWSAWVWPDQKTMAPTGFEPQKTFGIKKTCFVEGE
jgi:hypothetical protein